MDLVFVADVDGITFYISEFLQEGFGIFYFASLEPQINTQAPSLSSSRAIANPIPAGEFAPDTPATFP